MSATCDAVADRISTPRLRLRKRQRRRHSAQPAQLENWTLPILEFAIIIGAILA